MAQELEIPAHELEAIHNRAALDYSKIKSATLKGMALTYSYEETANEITDTVNRKAGAPIHKDLQKALFALSAHLALIIEDIVPEEVSGNQTIGGDIDRLTNIPVYSEETPGVRVFAFPLEQKVSHYEVTGISLSKASVTLSGSCKLSTDEFLEVTTPRIKWDESRYPFLNELHACVDTVIEEIRLYKNGKSAPIAHQTELDFDEALAAA